MTGRKIATVTAGSIETNSIPGYVAENIAQVIFAGVLKAWNTPEIREDYERWKAEQISLRA